MRRLRILRSVSIAIAGVALVGVLAACSDSSTSEESAADQTTSATPTTTDDCADVTALEDSLKALTEVEPVADGTDALKAAIEDVKSDLAAAKSSASANLQPQLDDVETAFTSLQDAVSGLTTSNLTEKAPEISASLFALSTALEDLGTAVADNCVTN